MQMGMIDIVIVILYAVAIFGLAQGVSLATPQKPGTDTIETADVAYATHAGFNAGALAVILILVALYVTWW